MTKDELSVDNETNIICDSPIYMARYNQAKCPECGRTTPFFFLLAGSLRTPSINGHRIRKITVKEPSVLYSVESMTEHLRKHISLNFPMYRLCRSKDDKSACYCSCCFFCGAHGDGNRLSYLSEEQLPPIIRASRFHKIDILPNYSFRASYISVVSIPKGIESLGGKAIKACQPHLYRS